MTESEDIKAFVAMEDATGTIQCNNCDYWGEMPGYINPESPKFITFVCPKCDVIEKVLNPLV